MKARIIVLILLILSPKCFPLSNIGGELIKVIDFNYQNDYIKQFDLQDSQIPITLNPFEHSGKFFLIRSGIQIPSLRPNRTSIYLFPSSVKKESCSVENLQQNEFLSQSNDNTVVEKLNFLRNCIKYKIEDKNKGLVEFDTTQESCKIERLNDYSIVINGSDCFLKAKEYQILDLEFYPDPNCKDRDFLVKNKISPTEILGNLHAYIYPRNLIGSG